ncbi:hypothetical protein AMJ52_07980 [candidate division TA06 bacterium DG_78]|uniref:Uncharacterized protein n=1 Tax=candidate division TA06 bacterium DG_78 TaxID=1703772 RepID=A0A0S7YCZ9_UNCT6|nr:MAG: hypothetical protein AMJ52_07980 [candidate division TA06 bacterium DG_78]
MFMQKIQISIMLIILAATLKVSKASVDLPELDSIGRMPEITVMAPRYEYQDEAWLGMVEEVVVEARRFSNSKNGTISEGASPGMINASFSSKDMECNWMFFKYPTQLLMLLTFTFVILSIVYLSFYVYLAAKEVHHDRTEH